MKHVFYQGGHKVARTITNREDFLALRNSADNLSNVALARMGNAEAKARLVQFAYMSHSPVWAMPRPRLVWCSLLTTI